MERQFPSRFNPVIEMIVTTDIDDSDLGALCGDLELWHVQKTSPDRIRPPAKTPDHRRFFKGWFFAKVWWIVDDWWDLTGRYGTRLTATPAGTIQKDHWSDSPPTNLIVIFIFVTTIISANSKTAYEIKSYRDNNCLWWEKITDSLLSQFQTYMFYHWWCCSCCWASSRGAARAHFCPKIARKSDFYAFHCIAWHCMVLHGIALYLMVPHIFMSFHCWLRRAGCISQDTYLLYIVV